jgi:REP element-mobilizing transposase RayT
MPKTLGYMITFTTYGSWLQGDERRYVKNGKTYPENKSLLKANTTLQKQETVRLTKRQQLLTKIAILAESNKAGQKILALAAGSNHIHIVAQYIPTPIERIVAYYKKAARLTLKETGLTGNVWTRGYDVRYCFDKEALEKRIKYVENHNKQNI